MASAKTQNRVIELWTPIQGKAYWTVLSIVNDKQMAEDVLQEALIVAINKYHTLREDSKFSTWYITIAMRMAYDMLSKSKRSFAVEDVTPFLEDQSIRSDIVADDTFLQADYRALVFSIIGRLHPERIKYLFYLRYIEDKTIEDISTITGTKVGTLKAIYYQMRKDIGDILGEEYYKHG